MNHRYSDMDRLANLDRAIGLLLSEDAQYGGVEIPSDLSGKQQLLRALENVRLPIPASEAFLEAESAELQAQLKEKGIVEVAKLPVSKADSHIALWQGDITRLNADAIVNAANSQMLGCWHPLHGCIDNAIHSAAGVRLRIACNEIMQGREAETGEAIITEGFNLSSKYVIHTVGPIISLPRPSAQQERQLADCYRNSLRLAADRGLRSIAFCCISTGEFRFPNDLAADIAIRTVTNYLDGGESSIRRVIFNVFKDLDFELYAERLA